MPHPTAELTHRNGSRVPADREKQAIQRPPGLLYGVDDRLPLSLALPNGVQHVGVVAINLIYPLAVFRVAGAPVSEITALLSIGLVVLGVGALLQSWRKTPLGCGFMAPTGFAAAYFGVSVLAAKTGGLPLVFGMTVFAGLLEILLSRILKRLRAFLPTELSGLVLFMIGLAVGVAAVRLVLAADAGAVPPVEWGVGAFTLGVMVALNVWGKGPVRMLSPLIGLAAGYGLAFATGLLGDELVGGLATTPWLMWPRPWMGAWSFDPALALPFAIVSLASAMKAAGTVATLTALLLNLLFRIGVKQRHTLRIGLAEIGGPAISDFLHAYGASWGARPEIVARASFAANQLAEAVAGQGWETGESTLEVSFDEFNLDHQFSYRGLPPSFPDQRPTEREIIESEHGIRLLAGYLLRHSADSIHSGSHGGMAQVRLHFDH